MVSLKNKLMRRFRLALLAKATPEKLLAISKQRLLKAFRAAAKSEAYLTLLREHNLDWQSLSSADDVVRRAPMLNKQNTFIRFSLPQLATPGTLTQIAGVLTSSGSTGRLSFGFST